MTTTNPTSKKGFWTKYAYKQISKRGDESLSNELFLLSEGEVTALKKIRNEAYLKAGLAGALGVILLYLPYHIWEESLFPFTNVWIPVYEDYLPLQLEFLGYSLVLVIFEIWYLTYLNIKTVSAIAHACGCPEVGDQYYEENVNALIGVGLEKKSKELKEIGINPYEGLSPIGVFLFQVALKLKAAVSGALFKLIIQKGLGRFLLRAVIDYAGVIVYAFWNIWGIRKIMNEARIRVMAPPIIRESVNQIYETQKGNEEFKSVIYSTLQLISESKRNFHYNHFLLSVSILNKFDITLEKKPNLEKEFLEKIKDYKEETKAGIRQLLLLGIIIDGRLSYREKKAIQYLKAEGVLKSDVATVKNWSLDFFNGKGIPEFLN